MERGESRKRIKDGGIFLSGVRDRLSKDSGLNPDYCFTFSGGEILHQARALAVTPTLLLSAAGRRWWRRTGGDQSGLPELLKIQGEWQVRKVLALIVNRSQVGSGPSTYWAMKHFERRRHSL